MSPLATQLSRGQILAKPITHLSGMEIIPYLVGDTAYPSRPYMLKNFKPEDPAMVDKIRYVSEFFYVYFKFFHDLHMIWSL